MVDQIPEVHKFASSLDEIEEARILQEVAGVVPADLGVRTVDLEKLGLKLEGNYSELDSVIVDVAIAERLVEIAAAEVVLEEEALVVVAAAGVTELVVVAETKNKLIINFHLNKFNYYFKK